MIEQITVNPINEKLFSAEFLKGFRCGAKRQFQADVEEIAKAKFGRPTGEWIEDGYCDKQCVCSHCGGSSGTQFDGVQPIPLKTKFCPNCGADMRKEKE